MRSLLPLFLISALSLYALFSWAGEETDALGCAVDSITGNYQCVTGPLAGREFISAAEAQATLKAEREQKAQDQAEEQSMAEAKIPFVILSWNFSSIGTKRFEYDRIVQLLAEADLAVLQEVEFSATGETAVTVIANMLAKKTGQRVCKGWFKSSSGERGRHAFIWRDRGVSFVEKSGMVIEHCSDAPTLMRLEGKKIPRDEVLSANFYAKARRQMFTVASVQWENKPAKKQAGKEIGAVFKKIAAGSWPVLVAGNFKMPAGDKAFNDAVKYNFKSLLRRGVGATSNLWSRNLTVVRAQVVDLQERYPELNAEQIEQMISNFPPLMAEISFAPEEVLELKTQLVKRDARRKAKAQAVRAGLTPPRETKPELKPLPTDDNLEEEAGPE